MRDRYGRNTFGQSCLMARRLVETGVPYVTINYEGWDTHKQHFQTMRRKLPELDRGMSALLEDLARPRPARQHDRLVERRVRADAAGPVGGAVERRPQPLRPRASPRSSPAAASRAARSSARPTTTGEEVAERPVYPHDLHRQHVRAARHRPRRPAAEPARPRRARAAAVREGGAPRSPEGDHVSARRPPLRAASCRGRARAACSAALAPRRGRRAPADAARAAARRLRLPRRRSGRHHVHGRTSGGQSLRQTRGRARLRRGRTGEGRSSTCRPAPNLDGPQQRELQAAAAGAEEPEDRHDAGRPPRAPRAPSRPRQGREAGGRGRAPQAPAPREPGGDERWRSSTRSSGTSSPGASPCSASARSRRRSRSR